MDKSKITRSISIIMLLLLTFMYTPAVHAASLSAMSDTMSREKASPTGSDHTIKFTTPTGVAGGQAMSVTFPAGFNMTTIVFGDIDISWGVSTGLENNDTANQALAASAGGATWGAVVAGQVLTITSGTSAIPAGNKVIIEIGTNATYGGAGTHQIVNHATPGAYTLTLAASSDSGTFQIVVVTDDQVAMTGSIDASITFSLSANASPFSTLTTGAIGTSSPNITLTVGTNANSGYAITVKDQGNGAIPGLYNAGTTTYITSATAGLSAGTEGYGIQATQTGGATIAAPYTASGTNVGALAITPQSLATYATSTSANHTITITHKAAIATTTKAGSYADTITYIATANF